MAGNKATTIETMSYVEIVQASRREVMDGLLVFSTFSLDSGETAMPSNLLRHLEPALGYNRPIHGILVRLTDGTGDDGLPRSRRTGENDFNSRPQAWKDARVHLIPGGNARASANRQIARGPHHPTVAHNPVQATHPSQPSVSRPATRNQPPAIQPPAFQPQGTRTNNQTSNKPGDANDDDVDDRSPSAGSSSASSAPVGGDDEDESDERAGPSGNNNPAPPGPNDNDDDDENDDGENGDDDEDYDSDDSNDGLGLETDALRVATEFQLRKKPRRFADSQPAFDFFYEPHRQLEVPEGQDDVDDVIKHRQQWCHRVYQAIRKMPVKADQDDKDGARYEASLLMESTFEVDLQRLVASKPGLDMSDQMSALATMIVDNVIHLHQNGDHIPTNAKVGKELQTIASQRLRTIISSLLRTKSLLSTMLKGNDEVMSFVPTPYGLNERKYSNLKGNLAKAAALAVAAAAEGKTLPKRRQVKPKKSKKRELPDENAEEEDPIPKKRGRKTRSKRAVSEENTELDEDADSDGNPDSDYGGGQPDPSPIRRSRSRRNVRAPSRFTSE